MDVIDVETISSNWSKDQITYSAKSYSLKFVLEVFSQCPKED